MYDDDYDPVYDNDFEHSPLRHDMTYLLYHAERLASIARHHAADMQERNVKAPHH